MNLPRIVLLTLATARLTRFVTSDLLGEWTVVGPLKRWAARREVPDAKLRETLETEIERTAEREAPMFTPPPGWGWRSKLVKGLDCGYCLSPWIFGGLLIGSAIAARVPALRIVWTWLLTTLAGSYAVGHLWNRLDNR